MGPFLKTVLEREQGWEGDLFGKMLQVSSFEFGYSVPSIKSQEQQGMPMIWTLGREGTQGDPGSSQPVSCIRKLRFSERA